MPNLQQAKQININLSQTLEQRQAEAIRQVQRSQWLAENKSALGEYNRRIERAARLATVCGASLTTPCFSSRSRSSRL